MAKKKLQNIVYSAIIASEASHVFCCVLPTVFSVLSLMAGLGMVAAVPGWLVDIHVVLHNWEVPLIILSGGVVALGWGLYFYSRKIDCHDHGCEHEPCDPKKERANLILKIATILFIVNVTVYGVFHRSMDKFSQTEIVAEEQHDH